MRSSERLLQMLSLTGVGIDPRSVEGHRQRDRHDEDEPTHQRPAAQADAYPEEQAREGPGELHRFGWEDRRQGAGVRDSQGVDEDLLRAAGTAQGSQEGHQEGGRQHVSLTSSIRKF